MLTCPLDQSGITGLLRCGLLSVFHKKYAIQAPQRIGGRKGQMANMILERTDISHNNCQRFQFQLNMKITLKSHRCELWDSDPKSSAKQSVSLTTGLIIC